MAPLVEGKSIGSDPQKKQRAQKGAHDLKNKKRCKLGGSKEGIQLKDSIGFKWVQIGFL
jgi:hypothetical protein